MTRTLELKTDGDDAPTIISDPEEVARVMKACKTLAYAADDDDDDDGKGRAPSDVPDGVPSVVKVSLPGIGARALSAVRMYCNTGALPPPASPEDALDAVSAMDYLDCMAGLHEACWAALPAIREALATPGEAALDTLAASRVAPLAALLLARMAARKAALTYKGKDTRTDDARTEDALREKQLTKLIEMVRPQSPWWKLGIVPMVLSVLIHVGTPQFESAFSTSYPSILSETERHEALGILRAAIGRRLGLVLELHEKGNVKGARKALNKVVNACRDSDRVLHLIPDRCPTNETQYADVAFLAKEVAFRFDAASCHSQSLSYPMAEASIGVQLDRHDDPEPRIAWEAICRQTKKL